jgi:hypothetical protein
MVVARKAKAMDQIREFLRSASFDGSACSLVRARLRPIARSLLGERRTVLRILIADRYEIVLTGLRRAGDQDEARCCCARL